MAIIRAKGSIKLNSVIYSVKSVLQVIFPLITMPYVLRVLGVENVGTYNFVSSIVGYFSLLAGFGLKSYAVRTGSIVRNDRKDFSRFASEIFTLNMLFSVLSYFLLFLCVALVPRIGENPRLVVVISASIILSTIGVEWVYSIYEDYLYITIRGLLTQLASMLLLFAFVKTEDDLIRYAFVSVVASAGANIFNFVRARKYCDIRLVKEAGARKHLMKSAIFFINSCLITIYVTTDQTILGFMCGDYSVGLYSLAVRVYYVIVGILTAASTVGIPKLSHYIGNGYRKEYDEYADDIFGIIVTLTIPAVTGLCLFSRQIVLIVGGKEYAESNMAVIILSVGMLVYVQAVFWGQCVLIPNGKEKLLMYATIVSALVNLVLNLLFIPQFQQNVAAFTTALSEGITAILTFLWGRKYVVLNNAKNVAVKSMLGCAYLVAVCVAFKHLFDNGILALVLSVIAGGAGYFIIEIMLKNPVVYGSAMTILRKICGARRWSKNE